ncbi:NAD-binding protein [Leucobacter allii]|uniref:ketopantoate reductase family protein n=1 Tax=Leucobacter allii TaxID=2932247 RepID=UPI001FD360E8|nr:2-dehydropantoate 2-reductase N-terminal domain-containing protein [Leucobacter allii]UOR01369.1 NAD-binding protein [Leucobacter allii]
MGEKSQIEGLRVAVLGAGANGSIIASDLAESGVDVTVIDQWPANIDAIRERGIRVQLGDTERVTRVPAHHLCEVAEMREPFDAVLLVMKAYDTRWATELITPLLHEDSFVVGVQNGMTADAIAHVIGAERTVGAVIEVTSAMYTPGLVERHSAPERCWFAVGALDPAAERHVPVAAELLRCVGIVEETDDIQSVKWMKLILNVAELVTSAVLDLSISDCARYPGMREVMLAAGNEAVAVAQAHGYALRPIFGMAGDEAASPETYVASILDNLVENYIQPNSRATVLQDWMKHRRSEVVELHDEVVRLSRRYGLESPVNARILELGLKIESGELVASPANVELMRQALRQPVLVPARRITQPRDRAGSPRR